MKLTPSPEACGLFGALTSPYIFSRKTDRSEPRLKSRAPSRGQGLEANHLTGLAVDANDGRFLLGGRGPRPHLRCPWSTGLAFSGRRERSALLGGHRRQLATPVRVAVLAPMLFGLRLSALGCRHLLNVFRGMFASAVGVADLALGLGGMLHSNRPSFAAICQIGEAESTPSQLRDPKTLRFCEARRGRAFIKHLDRVSSFCPDKLANPTSTPATSTTPDTRGAMLPGPIETRAGFSYIPGFSISWIDQGVDEIFGVLHVR